MKTPNKRLIQLVAVATTTGVIIPSCTYESNIVQSENLPAKGLYALELDLTKDELNYLHFIQKLSDDIVKYPLVAQEFAKNPQLFLEKYGYNESINLDEGILKLVLALGDEDINRAIKVGDVNGVLQLMKNKKLLNNLSDTYSYINISEEQTKEILTLMGIDSDNMECYSCLPGICYFGVLVVAVYIAAAVSLVGAGIVNWAYAETLIANNGANFIDQNLSFKIWALKDKQNDTYIAVDKYIEEQVSEVVNMVKTYNISFDELKLKEFLKLNILM